jgi:hypothetical protein
MASADVFDSPPENAIISEGNGAAVFIGLGGKDQVQLNWRPTKQYEEAKMLYQVRRSDGAILVSKTAATNFTDRQLLPNTAYGYTLTSFLSETKERTIKKGKKKGQKVTRTQVKNVGENYIAVLTLPGEVQGMYSPKARAVIWQPPVNQTEPLTYNIYAGSNLWLANYSGLSYEFPANISFGTKDVQVKVVAVNATGEAPKGSTVKVAFG